MFLVRYVCKNVATDSCLCICCNHIHNCKLINAVSPHWPHKYLWASNISTFFLWKYPFIVGCNLYNSVADRPENMVHDFPGTAQKPCIFHKSYNQKNNDYGFDAWPCGIKICRTSKMTSKLIICWARKRIKPSDKYKRISLWCGKGGDNIFTVPHSQKSEQCHRVCRQTVICNMSANISMRSLAPGTSVIWVVHFLTASSDTALCKTMLSLMFVVVHKVRWVLYKDATNFFRTRGLKIEQRVSKVQKCFKLFTL